MHASGRSPSLFLSFARQFGSFTPLSPSPIMTQPRYPEGPCTMSMLSWGHTDTRDHARTSLEPPFDCPHPVPSWEGRPPLVSFIHTGACVNQDLCLGYCGRLTIRTKNDLLEKGDWLDILESSRSSIFDRFPNVSFFDNAFLSNPLSRLSR